jgi:2-C-methyl-D-erythritol 4-phosphate cytidylyltransferase
MSKVCAIVLAAGKGTRMGGSVKKQFLNLNDKPILYYALKAFSDDVYIDEIVLVTAEEERDYCRKDIVEKYGFNKVSDIVSGGSERQQSVLNGLNSIKDCDVVLIHDGARPFVTDEIINSGIKFARLYGSCACGVMPKDTIKVKNQDQFSKETLERSSLVAVQTPQCFKYDIIYSCHSKLSCENISVTDDTMVVERYGYKVYLYEGNYNNIKITTPEDLILAERILKLSSAHVDRI